MIAAICLMAMTINAEICQFPSAHWNEMTVEREQNQALVKDENGKVVLRITTEGGVEHIKDVIVEIHNGALFIDPREAFKIFLPIRGCFIMGWLAMVIRRVRFHQIIFRRFMPCLIERAWM